MKECLYFSLQNKDLFSIWFINLLFKGIAAYSYSNTKRFSELKLETQARFHWHWPILQGRCKLKECLYLAGQSKETSFSVLDLLTCQLFIFLLLFSFLQLNWKLHSHCKVTSCPGEMKQLQSDAIFSCLQLFPIRTSW